VWSFVHIDDAARATVAALAADVPSGAYNIVDDEPAPVREWLPALAEALGAPRPIKVPVFVARLGAGAYGTAAMRWGQSGFLSGPRGQTPRNLMGFKDGTNNPSTADPAAINATHARQATRPEISLGIERTQ